MKKIVALSVLFISVLSFSQTKFALEAGGGVDISNSHFHSSQLNTDGGFSFFISPVFILNETFSVVGTIAYHRAEGSYYGGSDYRIFPAESGYSIDNPDIPNTKAYDVSLGIRASFSDKMIKPYFVLKNGALFNKIPEFKVRYGPGFYYGPYYEERKELAFYISPGLGIDFTLAPNFHLLLEGRFLITTGSSYTFLPVTTSVLYNF